MSKIATRQDCFNIGKNDPGSMAITEPNRCAIPSDVTHLGCQLTAVYALNQLVQYEHIEFVKKDNYPRVRFGGNMITVNFAYAVKTMVTVTVSGSYTTGQFFNIGVRVTTGNTQSSYTTKYQISSCDIMSVSPESDAFYNYYFSSVLG